MRPIDADELLELVGLSGQSTKRVGVLSGGQRRRLDVAIGLVGNPELLFLDEPTVGFDPAARDEFHSMIHRLSRAEGMTILLTNHDLHEAEKLSSRIAILDHGGIAVQGTVSELAAIVQLDDRVTYDENGQQHRHTVSRAKTLGFVRELLSTRSSRIENLEIHRPSLEESYLHLLRASQTVNSEKMV